MSHLCMVLEDHCLRVNQLEPEGAVPGQELGQVIRAVNWGQGGDVEQEEEDLVQ